MMPEDVTLSSLLSVCPGHDEKIHSLLSRKLSQIEESNLNEHLHSCAKCRDYFNFLNLAEKKTSLAFSQELPPTETIPLRLRDEMGESIRQSLASWLMEAGKSLLLIDENVQKSTYFKLSPLPYEKCTSQLKMIINTIQNHSYPRLLDLDTEFLSDCSNLISHSPLLSSNILTKSSVINYLNSSLILTPSNAETINILGLFYFCKGDFNSSIQEHSKALELCESSYLTYFCNYNISSAYFCKYDFLNSLKYLQKCQSLRNDSLVHLSIFLINLNSSDSSKLICNNLIDLDKHLENDKDFTNQSKLIELISFNIFTVYDFLKSKINLCENALKITRKYINLYHENSQSV